MTELTNVHLMRAEAEALSVQVDDAHIDRALDQFVRGPGETTDDFDFETAFDEIREQTQLDGDTIRTFIADRALADAIADRLAADLDSAPAQIRASQIVLPTEKPLKPWSLG